jgi:alkanesulfonate monooxygenase SsuD/methylene tetrahydromethanopterin reductase-like flavin-dependent oxidoreductase (luciferase family)
MREAVRDVRRLLAGEAVGFGPTETRLRNRSATPTPVYLLAAGPRMIELAGEVADGAFLMVGLDPAGIRAAREHLRFVAERAGRSLDGFPIVFVVTLGLGDDRVGARWIRSWFAPGQPFLAYPSVANLRWLAEAAVHAGLSPLVVVTGHQREQVTAALAGLDVIFVHNPDYAEGLSTSLRAGAE